MRDMVCRLFVNGVNMKLEDYINGAEEKSNSSESKSHLQMVTMFGTQQIREYILNNIVTDEGKYFHERGIIYIHDLDHIGPYCNSIDPTIPLSDGLNLPTIKAKPAKHFSSALDHLYSFVMYSQNHFAGAQSLDWFNWFMAPYAYMDQLTSRGIKQELQKFFFNCNQITRTGGKPPFINIGLRFECPKPLERRSVVWNGTEGIKNVSDLGKMVYSDNMMNIWARKIASIIMDILMEGMDGGIPFTYPLVAVSIMPQSDLQEDELWQKAFETVAKNGSLYFTNLRPQYMQDDGGDCDIVSSQCCRVRVKFSKVGGIWSGGEMGTGSNRIITLNLAAMGMFAKQSAEMHGYTEDSMSHCVGRLLDQIDITLDVIRVNLLLLNKMVVDSIYTNGINGWLANSTKAGIPYFNQCTRRLLVGVSFIHDMLVHIGFEEGILDPEGRNIGIAVIEHIREKLEMWMHADGVEYGLEAPPNESSNHHMALRNLEHYGKDFKLSLHGSNMSDIEYAPATHVPYELDIPLPRKIQAEAPFHKSCNGGNIFHFWLGEAHPCAEGIGDLIDKLSRTDLGYFALSPSFSICENNHCNNGIVDKCEKCDGEIVDHMDRVTGYYERISKFNDSKATEWRMRHRYGHKEM